MEQWTVKSVNDVPVEELNKPQEDNLAPEQEGIKGPEVPSDEVAEVELTKEQQQDAVQQVQGEAETGVLRDQSVEPTNQEEQSGEPEEEDSPLEFILEEEPQAIDEPKKEEAPLEPIKAQDTTSEKEAPAPERQLPEGMEKLIAFMEETGGSLEDYVNLNKNLADYNDNDLLFEYYRQTKGWNSDEIREHIQDNFDIDKEVDEPKEIRAKEREKRAELKQAKDYLSGNKEKYYAELKLRAQTNVDPKYQEALEVADNYRENQAQVERAKDAFIRATEEVFNQDFKGFEFNVGEDRFRYKINEPHKVREYQKDLNNFIREFMDDNGVITDAKGYHRAMFIAKNADTIIQHFYERGKAESVKSRKNKARNIAMDARKESTGEVVTKNGTRVRVVDDGALSSRLRFKNYSRTR